MAREESDPTEDEPASSGAKSYGDLDERFTLDMDPVEALRRLLNTPKSQDSDNALQITTFDADANYCSIPHT